VTDAEERDGRARVVLLDGVALLHPEDAVFEAMLEGWARQQRGGRRLRKDTIQGRQRVVRRFMEAVNEYPWTWTAGHVDEWMTYLVAEKDRSCPATWCRGSSATRSGSRPTAICVEATAHEACR
jgi:integrase/recombinase XerC